MPEYLVLMKFKMEDVLAKGDICDRDGNKVDVDIDLKAIYPKGCVGSCLIFDSPESAVAFFGKKIPVLEVQADFNTINRLKI